MDYILQHWYIIPIFAALIALTVFVWIKAIISGEKRKAEREKIIKALEAEKALRNQFKVIDENTFNDTSIDDERLIFGVAMNVQMAIEKLENMSEEYLNLSEAKRFVYALNFVFEDSKYFTLSDFFRSNGEPLLTQSELAVKNVIGGKFSEIFSEMFSMFDENSEASYDEKKLDELNEQFENLMKESKNEILSAVSLYIKENKTEFIS